MMTKSLALYTNLMRFSDSSGIRIIEVLTSVLDRNAEQYQVVQLYGMNRSISALPKETIPVMICILVIALVLDIEWEKVL